MAESIVLLVGGTKMLERELQSAVAAPLVSVATMEEATKVWNARPVRLVVLGPTLRRALQVVTMLRSDGNQDSQILVVYRDDQRDEVKRHQKGKAIADAYVAQSRLQRELAEAARKLWSTLATGEHDLIEELPAESVAATPEGTTQLMDVLELADDDEEPPPPPDELSTGDDGDVEVLGALDLQEIDAGDELLEEIAVEDVAIEEVPAAASAQPPPMVADHDDDPQLVLMTMENSILEELPSDDELDAKVAPPAAPNGATSDALDLEEIDLTADYIEEMVVEDAIEEIEDADLVQELHEEPEAAAAVAVPVEPLPAAVVPDLPAADPAGQSTQAHSGQEAAAVLPVPVFAAAQTPAPEVRPSEPVAAAASIAAEEPVAPAPVAAAAQPVVAPVAVPVATATTQPAAKTSGAHAAMFSELTTFVERLQDAANSIARLEAENEHLRNELAHAHAAARPGIDAELAGLRSRLDEVSLRLTGADQARDAAVEARMRAEQTAAARDDELARLRQELATTHAALAQANANAAAMSAQVTAAESAADARRRISADAARSLQAIAAMLDS